MNRLYAALAMAAALVAVPFALGHEPAGTPDRFCTGPTNVHDYGAPATRGYFGSLMDGNLEDCGHTSIPDVVGLCLQDPPPGSMCDECDGQELPPAWCELMSADLPADWDGEREYARGGAVLVSADPYGSYCWQTTPHHAVTPTVYAEDVLLGRDVGILVMTDAARPSPAEDPCGDGIHEECDDEDPAEVPGVTCNPDDRSVEGTGHGTYVPFMPGDDGAYRVYVGPGTQGHVWT